MVFDADQVTAEVAEGIEKIQNASNLEELKAIKTTYAGADSAMTKASKAIGSLPADQKKEADSALGAALFVLNTFFREPRLRLSV